MKYEAKLADKINKILVTQDLEEDIRSMLQTYARLAAKGFMTQEGLAFIEDELEIFDEQ